jgi:hypothetical protein
LFFFVLSLQDQNLQLRYCCVPCSLPFFRLIPSIMAGLKWNIGKKDDDTPRQASVDSMGRRPSAVEAMAQSRRRQSVDDHAVTGAGEITTRQSIIPVSLVTVLFFMWGFAYGLLDVLNKHFQETLHISAAQAAGLQGYVLHRRKGFFEARHFELSIEC